MAVEALAPFVISDNWYFLSFAINQPISGRIAEAI